jgi:hypothetical protein
MWSLEFAKGPLALLKDKYFDTFGDLEFILSYSYYVNENSASATDAHHLPDSGSRKSVFHPHGNHSAP